MPTGRLRVMVVEDDPDGSEVLADLVRAYGHDAEIARSGEAALALFLGWAPDLVLLDLDLPGMSGFEVASALRERGAGDLRIVAMSGYVREEDRARATEAGCDEHLPKPTPISDLERLLGARPRT